MASLIEQLQVDSLEHSASVTDLLRKAKVAAVKLSRPDFAEWVEHELSGYPAGKEVPRYRQLHTELKFLNPMRGWCPIVGADRTITCAQPIAEIISLLDAGNSYFTMSVPTELIEEIGRQIGTMVEVKQHISRAALSAIVDGARNTVLDWALKLEQAGVRGEGLSFSQADTKRAQEVTINIGNIGNAVGLGAFGDHASITATQTISVAEFAESAKALAKQIETQLPSSDLPAAVQRDATAAIAEIRAATGDAKPDKGRIRHGLESLRHALEAAAGHLMAAGAVALIDKLLAAVS